MKNLSLTKKDTVGRRYLSINDAATHMGVSRRSFYRITHNFTIFLPFGSDSDRRFDIRELDEYMDEHKLPKPGGM